jgi:hypothetical protein
MADTTNAAPTRAATGPQTAPHGAPGPRVAQTRERAAGGRTGPRIGSLCTGYGGLDLAVQRVFGGETVWHADIDPGATATATAA